MAHVVSKLKKRLKRYFFLIIPFYHKDAIKSINASCLIDLDCDIKQGLICQNGKCLCKDNSTQWYFFT